MDRIPVVEPSRRKHLTTGGIGVPGHGCGLDGGPFRVSGDAGNGVAVVELDISQILREPALITDLDGGVVVLPVCQGISAGPCRGLIGWVDAIAEVGQDVEDVAHPRAPIEVNVRRTGHHALQKV